MNKYNLKEKVIIFKDYFEPVDGIIVEIDLSNIFYNLGWPALPSLPTYKVAYNKLSFERMLHIEHLPENQIFKNFDEAQEYIDKRIDELKESKIKLAAVAPSMSDPI